MAPSLPPDDQLPDPGEAGASQGRLGTLARGALVLVLMILIVAVIVTAPSPPEPDEYEADDEGFVSADEYIAVRPVPAPGFAHGPRALPLEGAGDRADPERARRRAESPPGREADVAPGPSAQRPRVPRPAASEVADWLRSTLGASDVSLPVEVRRTLSDTEYVLLTLENAFPAGKAHLSYNEIATQAVVTLGQRLAEHYRHCAVEIIGHTSPRDDEDAHALSLAQARDVRDVLVRSGLDPVRIHTRGAGAAGPLDLGTSSRPTARNRRIEIRVKGLGPRLVEQDGETSGPDMGDRAAVGSPQDRQQSRLPMPRPEGEPDGEPSSPDVPLPSDPPPARTAGGPLPDPHIVISPPIRVQRPRRGASASTPTGETTRESAPDEAASPSGVEAPVARVPQPPTELAPAWTQPKTEPESQAMPTWVRVSKAQEAAAETAGVPVWFVNQWDMHFVLVPPGHFLRAAEGERGDRKVALPDPYYVQVTEVTNGQWRRWRPSHRSEGVPEYDLDGPMHPVVQVTWFDAVAFTRWLTEEDAGRSYALPTEAEWEYACRAGANGPVAPALGWGTARHYANFSDKNDPVLPTNQTKNDRYAATAPVASFRPSTWGLFDAYGNAAEWCLDWHGALPSAGAVSPLGPDTGSARVVRGGSWRSRIAHLSAAHRAKLAPGAKGYSVGIRLVSPMQQDRAEIHER